MSIIERLEATVDLDEPTHGRPNDDLSKQVFLLNDDTCPISMRMQRSSLSTADQSLGAYFNLYLNFWSFRQKESDVAELSWDPKSDDLYVVPLPIVPSKFPSNLWPTFNAVIFPTGNGDHVDFKVELLQCGHHVPGSTYRFKLRTSHALFQRVRYELQFTDRKSAVREK